MLEFAVERIYWSNMVDSCGHEKTRKSVSYCPDVCSIRSRLSTFSELPATISVRILRRETDCSDKWQSVVCGDPVSISDMDLDSMLSSGFIRSNATQTTLPIGI